MGSIHFSMIGIGGITFDLSDVLAHCTRILGIGSENQPTSTSEKYSIQIGSINNTTLNIIEYGNITISHGAATAKRKKAVKKL